MKIKLIAILLGGTSLASMSLPAHHGGSFYDGTKSTTVRGAVTEFRFVNPHVVIAIAVEGAEGELIEWSGELTSPNRLARAASGGGATNTIHWTKDILVPGDEIELTGNPARNGAPAMRITKVVDANRMVLLGGDEAEADNAPTVREPEYVWAVPENDGGDLRGVWMRRNDYGYQNYAFSGDLPPMTPWATARYEEARPTFGPNGVAVSDTNDLVYQCFPPGVPRIYFHPHPFEIVQTPGRVMIAYEYQQLLRQVFTDDREHRNDLAPMWLGDSTGRWEGDTLVVETVNFNDRTWIDRRGVPHSDQLRVVERIRRSNENELIVDITVEDPIAFTEPWTSRKIFDKVDWSLEEFVCLDDSSYQEFERALLEYDGGSPEE